MEGIYQIQYECESGVDSSRLVGISHTFDSAYLCRGPVIQMFFLSRRDDLIEGLAENFVLATIDLILVPREGLQALHPLKI